MQDSSQTTGIPSYANRLTIEIARTQKLPVPQHAFTDSLTLHLGGQPVVCRYFGPGHASDNIVVWIPSERVLFGGCMVKELGSKTPGNTTDADLAEWPNTIRKVIAAFPSVEIVIPGHGPAGGPELLKQTEKLLMENR